MKLLKTAHGVVLDVHVKPNSKKFRVKLDGDELVSGFTSRQKKFLISGIEAEEVNRILASASNTQ